MPPDILLASPDETADLLPDRFMKWFAGRGWSPREHQLALLAKARDDRSVLLIAPTGADFLNGGAGTDTWGDPWDTTDARTSLELP